ncbi:MAG: C4-dicarboxylic acid transporter DauA [Phycisphaerae bacterium]|nr:C4-dicarboxylic acid transporter DauA [Phycisphaerae bacterium]
MPSGLTAGVQPAVALRESFRAGYRWRDLRADVLAGLVVGVVALPLSMALGIASGVAPQHGLYTAIVAGAVTALLGGSRVQVTGPTAAFVIILAPISATYGVGGLMLATLMAGLLLIAMGLARLGRLIEFIPYPVTTGFTAGISVVIASLQVKDFLGLSLPGTPEHFVERLAALYLALPTYHAPDVIIGLFTLAVLVVLPRLTRRVPSPLVALPAAAVVAAIVASVRPDFSVATIHSRFSHMIRGVTHAGIPHLPPLPILPWNMPAADGQPLGLSFDMIRGLTTAAFAIAMLGAIESLLSAVVADGITGHRHNPDTELFAQGVGNVVAPFFGGIAATGAIARTATNIRSGARSPISAAVHSLFVLATMLLFARWLGYLPMASLAALLLVVAWNMSEARHFVHVLAVAPRGDSLVLVTCFVLTVLFDMVIAVSVGVVLAALMFMQRMAELAEVRLVSGEHPALSEPLPEGVLLYEVAGPLFFGAAQKAMSELRVVGRGVRAVVIDLSDVPTIDATGLVNLESAIERLVKANVFVTVGGVQAQPLRLFARAGWAKKARRFVVRRSLDDAIRLVREYAATMPQPRGGSGILRAR